jgi:uncharacterized membrane protein (DUF106 family)
MTFQEVTNISLGFSIGVLIFAIISILINGIIDKKYVSYNTLYEHNITIEQLPTKEYAKYILERKYQESLKELENQDD